MTFCHKFAPSSAMSVSLSGAAVAETTLIHGEAGPNRGARDEVFQWYADQVAERSKDDLKIDIQWGGALFNSNVAAHSISDGVADMGTMIAAYYPQEIVGYGIVEPPLNNPDAMVGMDMADEFGFTIANDKAVELAAKLTKLGQALVNQEQARVIVPPQQDSTGFWFGGGNTKRYS